ncbi:hypothetical protein TL16_g11933 [Triparma laevis f. inornata]|uniref:Uncharacterized protein n=1 Tax=Triparma laevis f. inornata TaxID=1714386 RepID=A0A9W7EUE0_9STRA|nr:hypothetical protein TL16_g11933 [Triparma laevis f. inornata]
MRLTSVKLTRKVDRIMIVETVRCFSKSTLRFGWLFRMVEEVAPAVAENFVAVVEAEERMASRVDFIFISFMVLRRLW